MSLEVRSDGFINIYIYILYEKHRLLHTVEVDAWNRILTRRICWLLKNSSYLVCMETLKTPPPSRMISACGGGE